MIPMRRPGLMTRIIEGEVVILDRAAQKIHQLNATAGFVWEQCDGSSATRVIAERLAARFDVTFETALRDVEALFQELKGLGLLDVAAPFSEVPMGGDV